MAKGRLRISIEDFLDNFGFGDKIHEWLIGFLESIEVATVGDLDATSKYITEATKDIADIQAMLKDVLSGKSQGGIASAVGFGANMGMSAASGLMAPLSRGLNYLIDSKVHSGRVDPAIAYAMYYRSGKQFTHALERLEDLGWTESYKEQFRLIYRPHLGVPDVMAAKFRGIITVAQAREEILQMGWSATDLPIVEELSQIIPPVQDLVTMAVREAFDPGSISSLGLDQELPGVFIQQAAKLGLSEEWASRYWYAHWRLPSVGQGFEMLHRLRPGVTANPFTIEDMRRLLKALDISPVWREKLIEISYNPITRVDVRRLYDEGILSKDEVLDNYLDIGYNDKNAGAMTEWTVNRKQAENKGITRSVIIKALKLGSMTSQEAFENLVAIGYDEDEAGFFISLAEFEIDQDKIEEILEGVEFLYIEGIIDVPEVYTRTASLNLPATQLEEKLELWEIKRKKRTRLASRSELDGFYIAEIINEAEYREQLINKRYPLQIIDWFVKELDTKNTELAKNEADRARKEEETLLARTNKTVFAIDKAAIDVNISEMKVVIAEIRMLAHELDDPDQLELLGKRLDEAKIIIANLNLEKSLLRHDLETALGA